MRYTLFLLSLIFFFSCTNENGPNPEEKRMAAQGLFSSGDTVDITSQAGRTILSTDEKQVIIVPQANGDTLVITISQEQRTGSYSYSVPVIDTVTKIYVPVIVPPVVVPPVTPPSTATRQNLLFEAGFDGTKPFMTENDLYPQGCCSYSITQSKNAATVRSGNGSFRAEVKGTDKAVSSGYRAELITSLETKYGAPSEVWVGYSTYFENWSSCSSCGEHVIQWHPNNASGSADLSLQTAAGKFDVVRSINGNNSRQPGTLKAITPNKWYDFVWHIKWSTGSTGLIELWINGELYYSFSGPNMSSTVPYFKFGINRWNITGVTRVLYYDNLRIGNSKATYNDVAPVQKAF